MRLAAALVCLALPAFGQGTIITTPSDGSQGTIVTTPNDGSQGTIIISPVDGSKTVLPEVKEDEVRAASGTGAELRGLDKTSGSVTPLSVSVGETVAVGRLEVTLGECRYPEDNPTGEGYAWLTIRDPNRDNILFEGWMVASSPALNALDHARYDVWVIRCTTA